MSHDGGLAALARRKLDQINRTHGTNHGDEYLAILIDEMVQQEQIAEAYMQIYQVREMLRNGKEA